MKKLLYTTIIIILLIIISPIQIQGVSGNSMAPALQDGDFILVSRYITPRNGDIVTANTSKIDNYEQNSEHIIKRYFKDDNGIYLYGDNKEKSYDSRFFGTVPEESIEYVVLYHFH